jgi:hypothetical protein
VVEDDDAVAHRAYFLHNMRGEDDRAVLSKVSNEAAYLDELVGVKTCGRLIKDEQLRVAEKCLRKAYALAVTFAQLTDVLVPLGSETDALN